MEIPSAHLEQAINEAFFFGEALDNGVSFQDMGERPTPGTMAALRGFWRGRNKYDNERLEEAERHSKQQAREAQSAAAKAARERYSKED